MQSMSLAQARRVALAAQGFLDKPHAEPTMRTFQRTLDRTGVLQVDSVNVLERAHYMPLYSRMGPYDRDLLRRAAEDRPTRVVEYWAHVQAYMPVELWPVMHHRMEAHRTKRGKWGIVEERPDLERGLIAEISARGPRRLATLDAGLPRDQGATGVGTGPRPGGCSTTSTWSGGLAISGRNSQFEILYDLPERVIPPEILTRPIPE